MRLQNVGAQTEQWDYKVGDIIRRKSGICFEHCGVLVGWDNWLRPLVFSISHKAATLHFQMVSLEEFEAGNGCQVVRPVHAGDLVPQAREGTLTDVIWARIQSLLKEVASHSRGEWSCEAIARFVVTGKVLRQPLSDRDNQRVA
jgi:hypothetical protein